MRRAVRLSSVVVTTALVAVGLVGPASGTSSTSAAPSVTVSSGVPTVVAPRAMVTGWVPYWNTPAGLAIVSANSKIFSDVSPFWFDARGTAPTIHLLNEYSTSTATLSAVAAFHALGLKVIPTVTDGTGWMQMSNQLSTVSGRATIVNALVSLAKAYKFDGIDLDWEQFAFNDGSSTWPTTRVRWIAFVKSLAAALHANHKLLSITVPAGYPTGGDSTGYYVYAWSVIGPVIDRMRIMTYDYSPSVPGPIGPFPWVDLIAKYAVTQVAASKIQIGVASYGRDWVWSSAGSCPTLAPAGATTAQANDLLNVELPWARSRHEFDSRGAANYVQTLFKDAVATNPAITLVQAPVSTWDNTQKERTFAYQVKFAGRRQPASVAIGTVGGLVGTSTVQLATTVGVVPGAKATGTGIAAGATVTTLVGNTVTLSAKNTAAVTGSLTFTHPVTTHVTTAATGSDTVATITVASATGIVVGALATGTGIAAGATVKTIVGTTVTLSAANTAAVTGSVDFATTATVTAKSAAAGLLTGTKTIIVGSTTGITTGAAVSGTGIGKGATVVSRSGNTVTLSVASTSSGNASITFKPAPVATSCTISRVGWYSEAQAALARATLVNKYHLGGIAQWTIGGEDVTQWAGLNAYAKSIAAVPSVVTVTGPGLLNASQAGTLSGSVTFKGVALTSTVVNVQELAPGKTVWVAAGTTTTDATGHFTLPLSGQPDNFSWRVTAPGDGWARSSATATGATSVAVAAVIAATAPRVLLPATPSTLSATVRFKGALLAATPVKLQVQRIGSSTWTTLPSVTTNAVGVAAIPIPGQSADFNWQVSVGGDGFTRLPALAKGTIGIAMPATVRAAGAAILAYGALNPIHGTITFKGAAVVAKLTVQVHTVGATTWRTVGTTTTSATGTFVFSIPGQALSYVWQVVVPKDVYTRLATIYSATTRVRVGVTATPRAAIVKKGARPVITGAILPAIAGYQVVLRRWNGKSWALQTSTTAGAKGTYTLTGSPLMSGTFRYLVQAYPPTGAPNLIGSSPVVTVRVG